MLLTTIKSDIQAALKAGDKVRLETLRFLLAAAINSAISKYGASAEKKLTDSDVLEVVKRQVKTHLESIAAFTKGKRLDLVAKEEGQLQILRSFLPQELSDLELRQILGPMASSTEANFGLLMGQAMALVAGRADGGRVASLLKDILMKEK